METRVWVVCVFYVCACVLCVCPVMITSLRYEYFHHGNGKTNMELWWPLCKRSSGIWGCTLRCKELKIQMWIINYQYYKTIIVFIRTYCLVHIYEHLFQAGVGGWWIFWIGGCLPILGDEMEKCVTKVSLIILFNCSYMHLKWLDDLSLVHLNVHISNYFLFILVATSTADPWFLEQTGKMRVKVRALFPPPELKRKLPSTPTYFWCMFFN